MSDMPERVRLDPDHDGWDDQIIDHDGWDDQIIDHDGWDDQGRPYVPENRWPVYIREDVVQAREAKLEARVRELELALIGEVNSEAKRLGLE